MNKNWICITGTVCLFFMMGCNSNNDNTSEGGLADGNGESEDFPNGNVNLSVFSSAGGSGDIFSRELARILDEETDFDENVIVENRDGGSGAIAINHMLGEPADGHTLLFHSTTAPLTMASGELEFTPDDIQPLAMMASDNLGFFVTEDSPYETLDDFIQDAEENPGGVNAVSSQTYGINHYFALEFMEAVEIDLNYIAYAGGAEAMTSLLGGNGDVLVSSFDVANPQVEAGEVRPLATTGSERRDDHPDTPTFTELNLDELEELIIWRGLFVHPDTPEEIQDRWAEILEEVTETDGFAEYTENTDQQIDFNSGEDFEEIFQSDYEGALDVFEDTEDVEEIEG